MATRWLFKTEPSVYSYQQLEKDKKTMWDGVANNLALKNLKDIQKGDQILIYHTGDERQAVGIARALGGAYPDPSKKDPKLLVVDIEASGSEHAASDVHARYVALDSPSASTADLASAALVSVLVLLSRPIQPD